MKKLMMILPILSLFILGACSPTETPLECDTGFHEENNICVEDEMDEPDLIDFSELYPNHGVYYEVFVRSFADSDGDGVGDFNGITAKLDYLEELGVKGLWLMPIHPSPTYHGYDVLDYYAVNEEYGTMEDFENLLVEAEKRDINIVIDFVINHSSNENPWFTAWQNSDPEYAGFYRKITSADSRYSDAPGLWHSMGNGEYYCGVFGSSMPDLNWSNPVVQEEMINIALYWMEKGVDGFRLDAAIHLEAEGEAKPPTIAFESTITKLEYFQFKIKEVYPDAYIVGEVWDSYTVSSKFFKAMDSAFNFEIGDEIINAVNSGYAIDYVDTYINRYSDLIEDYDNPIDAPFLKNHDQDRLASIFNGNEQKLKLAAEMLLTLPGNPFLYYGEEIGMKGEKTYGPTVWDETRRLPLLFGDEYETTWFNDAYNNGLDSVAVQLNDDDSLLQTYIDMIDVRNNSLALTFGDMLAYEENNSALLGYYRYLFNEGDIIDSVLVLHNISEYDYPLYIDDYDVLYYSDGAENFEGSIAPKSTVIFAVISYDSLTGDMNEE